MSCSSEGICRSKGLRLRRGTPAGAAVRFSKSVAHNLLAGPPAPLPVGEQAMNARLAQGPVGNWLFPKQIVCCPEVLFREMIRKSAPTVLDDATDTEQTGEPDERFSHVQG